jgi:hypothetical protein
MSEECPVCGAARDVDDSFGIIEWECGRMAGNGPFVSCPSAEHEITHLRKACEMLRDELKKHEESTRLLALYAEYHGQAWRDADERKGLHARRGSTSAYAILQLVECGEMEKVHDDNSWGLCAVWVEVEG